jgi:excinuclease UvrABC ATPase subunit
VKWQRQFKGVLPALEKAAAGHKPQALKFFTSAACSQCNGTRLKPAALAVKFGGASLRELLNLPIAQLKPRLEALDADAARATHRA